jgi:hypothetical protein
MIDSDRPLYAGVVYGRLPNELKGDPWAVLLVVCSCRSCSTGSSQSGNNERKRVLNSLPISATTHIASQE